MHSTSLIKLQPAVRDKARLSGWCGESGDGRMWGKPTAQDHTAVLTGKLCPDPFHCVCFLRRVYMYFFNSYFFN